MCSNGLKVWVYPDKSLSLSSESDSSLKEEMELSEVVTSGSYLYGEGAGTTANSASLPAFYSSDPAIDRYQSFLHGVV